MQIIGVTGNTGSGKSTVSKRICELTNAKYIDADKIARDLSKKRRSILRRNSKRIWRRNTKRRFRNKQKKACRDNFQ